tara:strand:- start:201 stop:308 length:108 start_codon:yes stop_codon:yes gene_type:complete
VLVAVRQAVVIAAALAAVVLAALGVTNRAIVLQFK